MLIQNLYFQILSIIILDNNTREIDTRTMSENREEILADFQVKHKANQLSLFALVLMIFHVFLNIFMNIK